MKALSLHREWIWAIQHLGKRVENRVWPLPEQHLNRWIAIHATKGGTGAQHRKHMRWFRAMTEDEGFPSEWLGEPYESPIYFPEQDLTLDLDLVPRMSLVGAIRFAECNKDRVPWSATGHYHWMISDARWLHDPIEIKGAQLLWTVPFKIAEQVIAGLNLTEDISQ